MDRGGGMHLQRAEEGKLWSDATLIPATSFPSPARWWARGTVIGSVGSVGSLLLPFRSLPGSLGQRRFSPAGTPAGTPAGLLPEVGRRGAMATDCLLNPSQTLSCTAIWAAWAGQGVGGELSTCRIAARPLHHCHRLPQLCHPDTKDETTEPLLYVVLLPR